MQRQRMRERYGRWALIAGGSEGIGAAFARALAAEGMDLVLVADKPEPLESFARELRENSQREVRVMVADLGDVASLERISALADELEVGALVCNAAAVPFGLFLSVGRAEKLRAIDVNCRAPLWLVDAMAPAMVARGRGAIVLMSSLAGRQGSALFATYAATKAFDLVLAESLHDELAPRGVDVLGVCAGATRTPGWNRAGGQPLSLAPPVMEPDDVAREALSALGRTPSLVAGRWNRLATFFLERVLPRRVAIETLGRSTRKIFRARL
jgi:short-subunit dehydrogenase